MHKFIYGVLIVAFVMFANSSIINAENLKIGYVDMAKLFEEYSETKIAKDKFNKDKFAKQEELQKKKEEIEKIKRELDGQRLLLSKEKAAEKAAEPQQPDRVIVATACRGSCPVRWGHFPRACAPTRRRGSQCCARRSSGTARRRGPSTCRFLP
mgnify:CR=1 FL=1